MTAKDSYCFSGTEDSLNIVIHKILEYNDFFKGSPDAVDVNSILARLSRKDLISFANIVMSIYIRKGTDSLNLLFSDKFFRSRKFIEQTINRLKCTNPTTRYELCSSKTAFEILRIGFSLNPQNNNRTITEEDIDDLFKVILVINQKLNDYNIEDHESTLPILCFLLDNNNSLMEKGDIQEFKDRLIFQLEMASEFFSIFSKSDEYSQLYQLFLRKYGIVRWEEYVGTFCFIYSMSIVDNNSHFIPQDFSNDPDGIMRRSVVDNSTLLIDKVVPYSSRHDADREANDDYRVFREHPLLKMPNGDYFVYCKEFIADKMYNSLYFELIGLAQQNNLKQIKVEQLFTKVFCEGKIFNNLIRNSYNPRFYKGETEGMCLSRYKAKIQELGPPDYILKKKNKIILFECKDIRMPGNILETKDYNQIIEVYSNKLYKKVYKGADSKKQYFEDGKFEKIGITQLTDHIQKIRERSFNWSKCNENAQIYPVLVLSDYKYLYSGFPAISNEWYYKELEDKRYRNRPVVVMSFITLRKYYLLFRKKGFIYYFEKYFKCLRDTKGIMTFDSYMSRYAYNLKDVGEKAIRDILEPLRKMNSYS